MYIVIQYTSVYCNDTKPKCVAMKLIASFDIGKKNFAQYVERFDEVMLAPLQKKYASLPKNKQRRVKGPMNDEIAKILEAIYMIGERVQVGVYDLRADVESKKLDVATRKNILLHLDSYSELWESCDTILIEQQFFRTSVYKGRGTEANVDAIKIGELVLGYFLNEYPYKEVLYFGSQNKTLMLGAPYQLDKSGRKKWASVKAERIYRDREDSDMIEVLDLKDRIFRKRLTSIDRQNEFIESCKAVSADCKVLAERLVRDRQKLDDISDCLLQLQAFKFRTFVALF